MVIGGFTGKDITRTALSPITYKEEEGADFPLHQQAQPAPPCLQVQSHILMEAGNGKSEGWEDLTECKACHLF